MSKHTPGPWYITGEMTKYIEANMRDGWVQEVATVGPTEADSGYGKQHEANARLIAAAPELLEALKRLLSYSSDVSEAQARAAIAKAEGAE